jgi:putative ABC transport system permease protein
LYQEVEVNWLRMTMARIRGMFAKRRRDAELEEELAAHLEMLAQENIERGMTAEEARRSARIELGGGEQIKEAVREQRGVPLIESLRQDVRFGLRMLRKNPGTTAVAVLTLALGIGATTAIFSLVDAWMIRPLPYPHSSSLMVFLSEQQRQGWTSENVSPGDFADFEKQNRSFVAVAAWSGWNFNVTGDGSPVFLEGGRVSGNFFDTLGVKPLLGRAFSRDEDSPGGPHVVVISSGLWQGRFGGDPNIIGRAMSIDDQSYTVIGVMPATFQYPLMGVANLWVPMALSDSQRNDHSIGGLQAFGRLKQGASEESAGAECATILAGIAKRYPLTNKEMTWLISPMSYRISLEEGLGPLMLCLCIVGMILLIACANVSNLLLARATRRTKEFAVRGALGATKRRIMRQLLTETVLLFLLGGVAGIFVGRAGINWIESLIPGHTRGFLVNYGYVNLDMTTLCFTAGIALICAVLFGWAPALANSRIDVNQVLKEASAQSSPSRKSARFGRTVVIAEVAVAVLVLVATSLLVKSFVNSVRASPGFNPANLMVAQLDLPSTKYMQDSQIRNFANDVLASLRALPQVASTGAASYVPFGGFGNLVKITLPGAPIPEPGAQPSARFSSASPDYFSAMQIALLKGRTFSDADGPDNMLVTVINRQLALRFWPGKDPIGQKIEFGPRQTPLTIVGIVDNVKMYSLRGWPEPQMYVPLSQFPTSTLGFVVRTIGQPAAITTEVRDAIWHVDDDQPISVDQITTLMAVVDTANRLLARMMAVFGALATFLSAIGIFSVMAHAVAHRTNEIGIRMALGADPARVMRSVLTEGMKLASIGIVCGAISALGATQLFRSMLYQVNPGDPWTFASVAIAFALIALLACYIPARRAMRVDPMVALRHE